MGQAECAAGQKTSLPGVSLQEEDDEVYQMRQHHLRTIRSFRKSGQCQLRKEKVQSKMQRRQPNSIHLARRRLGSTRNVPMQRRHQVATTSRPNYLFLISEFHKINN